MKMEAAMLAVAKAHSMLRLLLLNWEMSLLTVDFSFRGPGSSPRVVCQPVKKMLHLRYV
jgi:hypothetical protein